MPNSRSPRIEHVVVLMLENRSFDHLLGFLNHSDPAFDGLRPASHHNDDSHGAHIPATDDGVPSGLDPDHSHEGALRQLASFGDVAHNGGFVHDYEEWIAQQPKDKAWVKHASAGDVMRGLDSRTRCPVLATLALEFAVCQRWFSSVPGETWPNRNFAHAATSDSTVNIELGFYWDPTIFELIAKRGASWHIYFDGPPQVWCFRRLWRNRTILDFILRRKAKIGNWYEGTTFFDHVRSGELPNYSFIEPAHNQYYSPPGQPRQTNSQHPGNNRDDDGDFHAGEQLVKDVYQALLDAPELFAKTLLVIAYDEHGGLFDHVEPDKGVSPGDPVYRGPTRRMGRFVRALVDRLHHQARTKSYDFSQLGVRVPAVLVSPWIRPGTLVSKTLDHSSIPRTLHDLFAPDLPFLSKRDAAAAGFADVVTGSPLTRPRPNPRRPGPSSDDDDDDDASPPLPDLDRLLTVTSGVAAVAPDADGLIFKERPSPRELDAVGELDRDLVVLAERVHRTLERTPPALAARARERVTRGRAPVPEGVVPEAAPAPTPDAHPVGLFIERAHKARRRRV